MIDDPYKVLGISPDADKDEIKRAYRRKAKEYHPDLHPDDPQAAEKMNEINEAYDMLNNPEKYKKQQGPGGRSDSYGNPYGGPYGNGNPYGNSYGGNGSYGNPYGQNRQNGYGQGGYGQGGYGDYGGFGFEDLFGFGRSSGEPPRPSAEPGDSDDIRQAIDFINMRQYGYAGQTLNSVVSDRRNARWFYLSALTNYGKGNQVLALEQIQKAIQMEPSNQLYQNALKSMRQTGSDYNEAGKEFQKYAESMNRMCISLCMMQFFCMFCRC